jgi:hypothetical protein
VTGTKDTLARLFQDLRAWLTVLAPVLGLAALLVFWRSRFTSGTLFVSLSFVAAVLAALQWTWRLFGAPGGDEIGKGARSLLLHPKARIALYAIDGLLFAIAAGTATVQFKDPAVTNSVTILRLKPDSGGPTGTASKSLELTQQDPASTDMVWSWPWGRHVRYKALGASAIELRLVPWRTRVVNHPIDFNPFTLNLLVWPWFALDGRLPIEVSIESRDNIDKNPILGRATIDRAPVSVVMIKYQPDAPAPADSTRWAAQAHQLRPMTQSYEALGGDWRTGSVWLRTRRSLRPNERVRVVARKDGNVVATCDTTLLERTTDVHFTKSPH